jgi:phage-related protein
MWQIFYYNTKVKKETDKLPVGIRASYRRIIGYMQEYGPNLRMPYTRSLKGGLWEIRAKGKEGIARVFYMTEHKKKIIILHSFVKKSQKTPKKELDIARRRLKEVKND